MLAEWTRKAEASGDPIEKAGYRALTRVVSALLVRHGNAWGGPRARRHAGGQSRLQRCRQRSDRAPAGPSAHRSGPHRRLSTAAPPGATRGHEHQGRVGLGQEHAASAAKSAGGPDRCALGRVRTHQSRHLAQAAARLRRTGLRVQIWRSVHRRRSADHRPEARPIHGAQGGKRQHVAPAHRSVSLRQLRARFG